MVVHSPGRINIIGEHTDYNGGYVMPASIDKGIRFEVEQIPGNWLQLAANDLDETFVLKLPVTGKTGTLWVDYLAGIVDQFQRAGHEIPGLEISFGGDIPRGSGMSSSAALEGGMAFLLNEATGAGFTRPELAQLCQRSSNEFLDIPSGIMDQFASLNGSAEGPILLNCATLDFSQVSADLPGYSWVLINSMVTHELSGGEYHVRVRECKEALAALQIKYPTLSYLSEATPAQLQTVLAELPANVAKRANYVIAENQRIHAMAEALKEGNATRAGEILNATHVGLRDEYEVSCAEVDFLQEKATEELSDLVLGSRIMGGGFGGCTLNLIKSESVEMVVDHLTAAYQQEYGLTPEVYPVAIGAGTHLV
ncbi:galactokinase [Lewinella sp. 4G2]|uniref:galactokinase n=1 Tax=Lewinella sp. 4G2 TaxID=1803372 RepID=UPI0007B4853A|nr:galactokinase [Lewinella sp. 4G2]OAV45517.1 galactokinase [Lewinella sp. 4G2]